MPSNRVGEVRIMLRKIPIPVVAFVAALPLAACEVRVQRDEDRHPRNVDVHTPLGNLSVRSDTIPSDVGLPVYPGARPLDDRDEHDNANVSVESPFGDVRVAAMKFESDAAPEAVAEFYRREMGVYGSVTLCRGNIDFDTSGDSMQPRCRKRPWSRDVQVAVGTKGNFRLASVKPRGEGSEFAVVYVHATNDL